jgi:hypothetical protein
MVLEGLRLGALRALGIALCAFVALLADSASAAPHAAGHGKCCHIAAGTPVEIALVEKLSTETQKTGDVFPLLLASPLVVDGMVVVPAGARGEGEVIESMGPEIGGKGAKMVLAAKYIDGPHGRIALNALQLAQPGHDNSRASQLVGLSGMAFAPLRFVGIVVPGGNVEIRPDTVASAKVAVAVTLPPLRRANPKELASAAKTDSAAAMEVEGPIDLRPPPRGQGQVVFFRPKSLMGTGQWFKVRENGQEVGKLGNGVYFVQVTSPGVHTYSAKFEPELKDHLTLKVDPGETYFVEGALTGGLVVGAADLTPSTRERFEAAAKDLKPAEGHQTAAR